MKPNCRYKTKYFLQFPRFMRHYTPFIIPIRCLQFRYPLFLIHHAPFVIDDLVEPKWKGDGQRQSTKVNQYRARMKRCYSPGVQGGGEKKKARRIRPKYEITLHPCGLRKKFKTAISIKFNLAQVSNQAQRCNETGGAVGRLCPMHVSHP